MGKYYYLGDPCYIIHDDEWIDFCNAMAKAEVKREVGTPYYSKWKGREIHFINTGGDGRWDGLCVDAGVLSCIPVEVCDPEKLKGESSGWRVIDHFVELTMVQNGGILMIDGEPTDDAQYCQCLDNSCSELLSKNNFDWCAKCGDGPYCGYTCLEVHNGEYYCDCCYDEVTEDEE